MKPERSKMVNEQLYTGRSEIQKVPTELINEIYEKGFCETSALLKKNKPTSNHFYVLKDSTNPYWHTIAH